MDFWGSLDNLVLSHKLVIDRPRAHPGKNVEAENRDYWISTEFSNMVSQEYNRRVVAYRKKLGY